MFDPLYQIVVEGGHGVRAYGACARAARERIASERENAAALMLIMTAAQGVVEAYDDQPMPVDIADGLLKKFGAMVKKLSTAYTSGSAEAKEAALNDVAVDLVEFSKN